MDFTKRRQELEGEMEKCEKAINQSTQELQNAQVKKLQISGALALLQEMMEKDEKGGAEESKTANA